MKLSEILLILFVLEYSAGSAQNHDPAYQMADKCIQEYMQLSRLGPGYSRDLSRETTGQFKTLFERDAFLYWDLFRSSSDSLIPPLPVGEYVDLAEKLYHLKQPILDYPGVKIRIQQEGKCAVVYLKKTNQIMDMDDKPLNKNMMRLRIDINLNKEKPSIQNIAEDKRASFIRSISVGVNYCPWSNVVSSLTVKTVIPARSNEQFQKISITSGISIQGGMLLEMNVNRNNSDGITFSTGIFYSQLPLSSSMTNYSRSFPDTLDQASVNPVTCTTFERSPEVTEKIVITKLEIPLLFKSYLNQWMYVKAGTALGYVTGTSDVKYVLSRTGGGLLTNLITQNQYYLDKDHELDQRDYGYYLNKSYWFPKDKILQKVTLSIQLAAGFEKQFNNFSFGLEPNISFGMNPLSTRALPGSYQLNNVENFHSILESVKIPAFEFAIGVRLLISYLFKH